MRTWIVYGAIIIAIATSFTLVLLANMPNTYFEEAHLSLFYYLVQYGHLPHALGRGGDFWTYHANNFIHYPAPGIIITFMSIVSGIPGYKFIYVPVMLPIWILEIAYISYIFLQKRNLELAFAIILISVYTTALNPARWSVSYVALGFIGHLGVIIMLSKYICSKNIKYMVLMYLFFSLSQLSYYSPTTFSIVFILSMSLTFVVLSKFNIRYSSQKQDLLRGSLVMLAMFLTFDYILWIQLSSKGLEYINVVFIFRNLLKMLITEHRIFSPIFFRYDLNLKQNEFLRYIHITSYIVLPLVILIVYGRQSLKNKFQDPNVTIPTIVQLSTLSVAIYETIPYYPLTKWITLRYLMFFGFVITVPLALRNLQTAIHGSSKHYIAVSIMLIVIVLAPIAAIYNYYLPYYIKGYGYHKPELFRRGEYYALTSKKFDDSQFYSNFQISGELRISSLISHNNEHICTSPFYDKIYSFYNTLYTGKNITSNLTKILYPLYQIQKTYLILSAPDFKKPIYGDAWGYVTPPLTPAMRKKVRYSFEIVYTSEDIQVYLIKIGRERS